MAETTGEVTELLQLLIRNACVNDGSVASGGEIRSAETLRSYLESTPADLETYEPQPGRANLVARVEGSDPDAPTLLLMGHTDVVPANVATWSRDPYGGELVDGVVWGRGAVDMLNLTASMAVAFRRLASEPSFAPRGTLVYLAVADEEAGGTWGAEWLVDHEPDAVRADFVVTELGGVRLGIEPDGAPRLPVAVAEKGVFWGTITLRGRAGHGSMPYRTDNALVTAAEAVRRLDAFRPPARITEVWRSFVDDLGLPETVRAQLQDPSAIGDLIEAAEDPVLARFLHAGTHTTLTPTVMSSGVKANVIPDSATIEFDVRTLPGQTAEDVVEMMQAALGDLSERAEIEIHRGGEASSSPVETPLWDVLQRHAERLVPNARNVPSLLFGGTDSRHLRRLGATCYGYGAYSDQLTFGDFAAMFHGDDERIDEESLERSTDLWHAAATDLLT